MSDTITPRQALRDFLTTHGQGHRTDQVLKAYGDGTLKSWLAERGLEHLGYTQLPALLLAACTDAQYAECRLWADWFREAGYDVQFTYTDLVGPFDREWRVYPPSGQGARIGTIDIDGCGASWHGPDDLWLTVIGPKVGVTR